MFLKNNFSLSALNVGTYGFGLWYWTSSQASRTAAYAVHFEYNYVYNGAASTPMRVRLFATF